MAVKAVDIPCGLGYACTSTLRRAVIRDSVPGVFAAREWYAMRIVVNGWFAGRSTTGSGQYLAALVEWLPAVGRGHELNLVMPYSRDGQPSLSGGAWRSLCVRTPFDGINHDLAKLWFEQFAFPNACRRLQADVAFVPYWGSSWWRPCRTVVTIHDLIPLLLPEYRGGLPQRAYTWWVSRTARRAHAVITDSEASRRDIMAGLGIPGASVHAIHLAAPERYRCASAAADMVRVRRKYGLPDGPFILYLGGFDVRKNLRQTIKAYALLTERLQRAARVSPDQGHAGPLPKRIPHLVIAGRLPEADSALAPDPRIIVDELGLREHVHFTGWIEESDKPVLYSMAAVSVFVSEYEGFGLPVLEAMGCSSAARPDENDPPSGHAV